MRLPVQLPKKRKPDTHKGDYGYVFVLGGSPGLTGAVCLCAQSALRAGCGLVRVGVPLSLNSIFEIKLTEAMSEPLRDERGYLSPKAYNQIVELSERIDVFAVGCGASRQACAKELILRTIKDIDKPMVIDADGINALAGRLDILRERKTKELILTPHLAEFSRLMQVSIGKIETKRKVLVRKFAQEHNLILVLKGHRTLVSDGKKLYENRSGNPGMATAGMGDVLTGIISGLCAQGLNSFEAAKLGVYLHGLAGDLAAKEKTQNCLIASDVIECLPKAIKAFKK